MDREELQIELKALVTQCIDLNQTNNAAELMKAYIKDKYLKEGIDIDVEHLDIDYKFEGKDLQNFVSNIVVIYGNLYTFVLCQSYYVPYYNWVYDSVFESKDFVFSRRIYSDFHGGGKKSSYSIKDKQTNKVMTYDGKEIEKISLTAQDMEDPETGERPH